MSVCRKYERMISTDIDGELSPEEEREMQLHLNSCRRIAYHLLFSICLTYPKGQSGSKKPIIEHLETGDFRKCLVRVIEIWHLMALSLALGLINALDNPARQAFYHHKPVYGIYCRNAQTGLKCDERISRDGGDTA